MKKIGLGFIFMLVVSMLVGFNVGAEPASEAFDDVNENVTNYEGIDYLYQNGIVNGNGKGQFFPNDNLTRIEGVMMLFRSMDIEEDHDYEIDFKDVPDYVKGQLNALYKRGVIDGYTTETFGTYDTLTREQMMKILVEGYGWGDEPVSKPELSDVGEGRWFTKYISIGYDKGITRGYADGSFGVHDEIMRKNFSAMLARAMKIKDKEDNGSGDNGSGDNGSGDDGSGDDGSGDDGSGDDGSGDDGVVDGEVPKVIEIS